MARKPRPAKRAEEPLLWPVITQHYVLGVSMGPTGQQGPNHWRTTDQYDTAKPTSPREVICTGGSGESTRWAQQPLADGDAGELRLGVEGGEIGEFEAGHGADVSSLFPARREGIRGVRHRHGQLGGSHKSKGSPESPKTRAVHLFRGTEGGKAVRAELVLEPRRQVALGQLWSRNNVNTPREAGASRARLDTAEREGASDRGRVRRGG